MSSSFQTPGFKKLFQEWNQILKDSGFEDAENFSLQEAQLKSWHNFKFKNISESELSAIRKYFDRASQILHSHKFHTNIHKIAWQLHAEGKSIREIVKIINFRGFGKDSVCVFIQKIQRMYGLRER